VRRMRSSRAGVRTFAGRSQRHRTTNTTLRSTHLDPNVIRDLALLNKAANKVEVRVARSGVGDLDLLQPRADELVKEPGLLLDGHRVCKRLVAIT
jgi:hypothetical protein